MRRLIYKLFPILLFPLFFSACSKEELGVLPEDDIQRVDGLPIDFNITISDNQPFTRGIYNPRVNFETGDVLHITATFTEDGEVSDPIYNSFVYDATARTWTMQLDPENPNAEQEKMVWPNNADSGNFTAYYVPGSNYLLHKGESSPEVSLSALTGTVLTPDLDPLTGNSGDIVYGHTVNLTMIHACAYLKIEDIPSGISDIFWFSRFDDDNATLTGFNNAFKLSLSEENELTLDFFQQVDPLNGGAVYIEGNTETEYIDGERQTFVGFFLEPGDYTSFTIGYPGDQVMINYLSYKKPIEEEVNTNHLESNGYYTFNISKSTGVVRVTDPDEADWDKAEPPYVKVDADEFIWSVVNGEEYSVEVTDENQEVQEVKVLEKTTNGVRMVCSVDMQNAEYTIFPPSAKHPDSWFEPNLDNGKVFDGAKHYIMNLGSPLLRTNNGTIRNIGIRNADITVVTDENPDQTIKGEASPIAFTQNRQGSMCNNNLGTIENCRFFDIDFVAQVNATSSQESHSIGLVAGENSGTISGLEMSGDNTITLSNYTGSDVIPTLNVGGLIGQNLGTLSSVTVQEDKTLSIEIINTCNGERGVYALGGIIGTQIQGKVSNVILQNITINSVGSFGQISMIGGMTGINENINNSFLSSCIVTGSVSAGKVQSNGQGESYAYTGGMTGRHWEAASITSCSVIVDVHGTRDEDHVPQYVTYGTGGIVGCISRSILDTTFGDIENLISTGTELTGPVTSRGNFAGIVPTEESWDNPYKDRRITVRQIVEKNIGTDSN